MNCDLQDNAYSDDPYLLFIWYTYHDVWRQKYFIKRVHDHEVEMMVICYSIFTEVRYIDLLFLWSLWENKISWWMRAPFYLYVCNWFFREEFCHFLRRSQHTSFLVDVNIRFVIIFCSWLAVHSLLAPKIYFCQHFFFFNFLICARFSIYSL